MILQHERLKSAVLVENGHLLVVERAAEYVGCGVDVRIHEACDRADRRGRGGKTRTCANNSRGSAIVASPAPPTIATPPLRNSRRVAWWQVWPSCAQPKWIAPGTRGRPQLSVNFHRGRLDHLMGTPPPW